jgi:hypothetical protein
MVEDSSLEKKEDTPESINLIHHIGIMKFSNEKYVSNYVGILI